MVGVDNLMFGQWTNNHMEYLDELGDFRFIHEDIRGIKYLPALTECDVVYHLAALVGAPLCDKSPQAAITVNKECTEYIVDSLCSSQRIIYPNTNSGYGTTEPGTVCNELTPLAPISVYAESKLAGEQAVLRHKNSVVFRLATVFGCSLRTRLDLLVNHFAYLAYFDKQIKIFEGNFRRNFVHVQDVVDAMVYALDNLGEQEVYNLGNDGENTTKEELAANIAKRFRATVSKTSQEDKDKRDYVVSSEKLSKAGFTAQYKLEYGLNELARWFALMDRDKHYREPLLRLHKNA